MNTQTLSNNVKNEINVTIKESLENNNTGTLINMLNNVNSVVNKTSQSNPSNLEESKQIMKKFASEIFTNLFLSKDDKDDKYSKDGKDDKDDKDGKYSKNEKDKKSSIFGDFDFDVKIIPHPDCICGTCTTSKTNNQNHQNHDTDDNDDSDNDVPDLVPSSQGDISNFGISQNNNTHNFTMMGNPSLTNVDGCLNLDYVSPINSLMKLLAILREQKEKVNSAKNENESLNENDSSNKDEEINITI